MKERKRFQVDFTTTDGDYSHEWCYADSAEEAIENIKHEHWDIKEILSAHEF